MGKVDQAAANTRLRAAMRDLRETSALLRVKATNLALGNRRLLREIKRRLKKGSA